MVKDLSFHKLQIISSINVHNMPYLPVRVKLFKKIEEHLVYELMKWLLFDSKPSEDKMSTIWMYTA